jgi:hypothetical protein
MWRGPLGAFESEPLVFEAVETVHALAASNTKTMLGKGEGAIVKRKPVPRRKWVAFGVLMSVVDVFVSQEATRYCSL